MENKETNKMRRWKKSENWKTNSKKWNSIRIMKMRTEKRYKKTI